MDKSLGNREKIYDWEERAAKFGKEIIEFAQQIPQNVMKKSLIFRSSKIEH